MIIEKNINGSWTISELVNGALMSRTYYGYTKREAISLFQEERYSDRMREIK